MIEKTVAELMCFASSHWGLDPLDKIYLQNYVLRELKLVAPYEGEIDEAEIASLEVPDRFVEAIIRHGVEALGLDEGEAERKAEAIMGLLSPLPSVVTKTFDLAYENSPKEATDYLYRLSIASHYVQKTKDDRNEVYEATFPEGSKLEISINLSKPEKNNKDIAKLVGAVSSSYPKCLLCLENLGFEGNAKKAPRGNIRIIPLTLNGERWYLQYSPYGYFDEHCILFHENHVPMEISKRIFACLIDFVDLFPHYFIGSNSDLPIVGGSILDHEHFQGGLHLLPIFFAPTKEKIALKKHPGLELEIVDFYDTVLKITGEDKEKILSLAEEITLAWRGYGDPSLDIIASDEAGQHSTVTPLVRKTETGYEFFLILRNNRCDETYPGGIFHAHPEYAHIKQEGIGLIEAAGRFILPARLLRQSALVEDIVKKGTKKEDYLQEHPDLAGFDLMVETLKTRGISARTYMGEICRNILCNVAVFKDDAEGQAGLSRFLRGLDL